VVNPESIALIGASENVQKFGGRILHNVVRHGYQGRLLPINPNRNEVLGLTSYPSIAVAPGPIDLAVIAVPAVLLRGTVEECARAGVGACVVITAQTAEFDAAGAALQNEIVDIARRHGMRLVGPNCMGMINAPHSLALSSTLTLQHVERLRRGGVALVSQSGALMGTLFVLGDDHGVGFSRLISVGNQADLELCDFFEYLIDDPHTTTICLYIEGLKSPRRFMAAARRAAAAGKAVLAVKAGRTDAGMVAARSHTASLAGSYESFESACRASGVVVMDEPEGMILVAGLLDRLGPIGGGGIGLVVSSGGGGAVTADRITAAKLPLAAWSKNTKARLERYYLPAHVNNPIDLGSHKGTLSLQNFAETIRAVADDSAVAVMMYVFTPQPMMMETAQALVDTWNSARKPCVVVLDAGSFAHRERDLMINAGLPVVSRIDDGLRTIEAMFRLRTLRSQHSEAEVSRPLNCGPLPPKLPVGRLTEGEVKALLRAYGVPATGDVVVHTAEEAVKAAARIGYPVVLKGVSRSVVHKSDAGLVKLDLPNAQAVRSAFAEIATALASSHGGAIAVGVQEMARGQFELIIGARHDPDFGSQILVGSGGIWVEVLGDARLACAPVSPKQVKTLLRELEAWPALAGGRGRPQVDIEAIAEAVARISWLSTDLGPRLRELDINPLLVRRAGEGVIAVDGRATLEQARDD
jgi:acyl-CoA synthetase (NDP forming)